MKFAYLVMTELRAIKKTIKNIIENVIDYYNADVFILCQKTFNDDEENADLFKNIIYKEFYDKPNPVEYFNNLFIVKNLGVNANWNKESCLQIYINYHKMAKILEPYINDYDYFITLRTDIEILFPFPDKKLFNDIPKGLYTFKADYAKTWGGLGGSVFTHKDYILDYLNLYYNEIINISNDTFLPLNQENLLNYCMNKKNFHFNYLKNLNFYYTAEKINDYTTWSVPVKCKKRNIIYKYSGQVTEAYKNLKLWKNNFRWSFKNNILVLQPIVTPIAKKIRKPPIAKKIRTPPIAKKIKTPPIAK